MKTAILLTFLVAGTGFFLKKELPAPAPDIVASYTTSRATRSGSLPVGPVRIVVEKSKYELHVYDAKGWYATYPVVFGNNSLADKCMEGDRCTPEGTFRIVNKRSHEKWSRYMGLDYPTRESLLRFQELKRRGAIPKNASPGGGVGIHGTWPQDDYMIDRYSNWTNGCISMKNNDMRDFYNYVPVGTTVTIKK